MDKIIRKININNGKSFLPGLIPGIMRSQNNQIIWGISNTNGNWGLIVSDILVSSIDGIIVNNNFPFSYQIGNQKYLKYDDMMQAYRRTDDSDFKNWVEYLIGKINVPDTYNNEIIKGMNYNGIEYLYLGALNGYINQTLSVKNSKCLCEKYKTIGGDAFLKWLNSLQNELNRRKEKISTISRNYTYSNVYININAKFNDLGIIEDIDNSLSENTDNTSTKELFKTYGESQLNSLKRKKITVDDNGEELPFFIDTLFDFNEETIYNSELLFKENVLYNIEPINDIDIEGEYFKGNIITSILTDDEYITFKYTIGGIFQINNNNVVEYLDNECYYGIKYTDKYRYNTKQGVFRINNKNVNISYKEIKFIEKTVTKEIENIDNAKYNTILSEIEYYIEKEQEKDIPFVRQEYKINLSLPSKFDDNDIYIDRGINSAFEKILKLSEAKSIEEMENYGNNYWNIR